MTYDDFARRHLTAWFDAGMAPSDWDRETLTTFAAWVEQNADDLSDSSSWTDLARYWEAQASA